MRLTRRRALQSLTATAAAAPFAGLSGCETPPEVTPSLLELARARIDTVVVLMMENRSFDHSFGALTMDEGRSDVDGLLPTMSNPDADGAPVFPRAADAGCIGDPPHSFNSSHLQWNNGACDGFVREYQLREDGREAPYRVMDYLPRTLQPASLALADQYALCQRSFASVMGPTWPNRYYWLGASSYGTRTNDFLGRPVDHLFSRLDEAKVSWANYYANIPFSIVYEGMSLTFPEMQKHEDFFAAAEAGTLAPVVVLDPVYGRADDHPPAHPLAGQIFIQSVYEALRRSPQWSRCLFVVTYDEHGGFHDHVSPPTVADDFAADGFDQLGFRVPTVVVGPYVNAQVSDLQLDHSSFYATIAALHGLAPIGARDAAANTWLSLLDETRLREQNPRVGEPLPAVVADEAEIFADECKGFVFHGGPAATEGGAITGQVELERAFAARYPEQAAMLRAVTDDAMRGLLQHAERLGVWRRA